MPHILQDILPNLNYFIKTWDIIILTYTTLYKTSSLHISVLPQQEIIHTVA